MILPEADRILFAYPFALHAGKAIAFPDEVLVLFANGQGRAYPAAGIAVVAFASIDGHGELCFPRG